MHKSKSPVMLLSLFLSMVLIGNVDAEREGRGARGGKTKEQQSLISRDRAAAVARSATGGRVLNIRFKGGKRPKYRVKVLVDGNRVRNVGVDARSGGILK